MKKIISILLLSSFPLFATEDLTEDLIKAKDSYTQCVISNLSQEKNVFSNFIKSTPKENLTYKSINNFFKDYMIKLMENDICTDTFNIYLEKAIIFDKELSKNEMFAKPVNFDFAAYNKNLIFDLTSSYIYFNKLLKEKK